MKTRPQVSDGGFAREEMAVASTCCAPSPSKRMTANILSFPAGRTTTTDSRYIYVTD